MRKTIFILFLLSLFSVFVYASDFPKIKGYKQDSEVRTYTPDNLWEYINGAADQFLDYEFQLLQSCDLSKGDFSVSVDIYDMGSSLNAYGIYMNERPTNKEKLAFGVEAILSPPYQALLLKDNFYVKIDVLESEINDQNGKPLLMAIAEALEGSNDIPNELNMLPSENMILDSQKYANKAFLGLRELNKCIYADYSDGGKEDFQYFVMNFDQKTTKSNWDVLKSKWETKKVKNIEILIKNIPYQGPVGVLQMNDKIYGVSGFEDEDKLLKKLIALLN